MSEIGPHTRDWQTFPNSHWKGAVLRVEILDYECWDRGGFLRPGIFKVELPDFEGPCFVREIDLKPVEKNE